MNILGQIGGQKGFSKINILINILLFDKETENFILRVFKSQENLVFTIRFW